MGVRSVSPRRRVSAPERRAQILEAALRCFGDRGYHLATMDDLARTARLSKGSLYWHFRSKEDVLLALFDGFAEEALAGFRDLSGSEPVLEGICRAGNASLERLGAALPVTRAWLEFFANPEARQRMASVYEEVRALLASLLAEGVGRGELREIPVESVAAGFVATVEGLLMQAFADPRFDARRHWPKLFEVWARGLRVTPSLAKGDA
ncbi:MAG: TetR/AcrR family transcriptional regulator [Myxococcota bacterium]